MIGMNVPVFTVEQKKDGMAKRIANCVSDKNRNIQSLKNIKVCLTIMEADKEDLYKDMKETVLTLLAERTAEVKARYEKNGWAFNF